MSNALNIIVTIIICAACVGILMIAMHVFGIPVPEWAWQMAGIVIVAAVAIFAIKFLFSL